MTRSALLAVLAVALGSSCKKREVAPPSAPVVAVATADAGVLKPPLAELMRDVAESASGKISEGFDSRDDIIESLDDLFGSDYEGDDFRARVTRGVDLALAARKAEEATWPPLTDCDRLDRAFAVLEKKKIVAREDFADCQTCGTAEIADLVEEQKARGYVYFHDQDTEGVVSFGALRLAFGGAKPKEGAKVGREIVAALRAEGLEVKWSGSVDQRITVLMDWKKRRFTTPTEP